MAVSDFSALAAQLTVQLFQTVFYGIFLVTFGACLKALLRNPRISGSEVKESGWRSWKDISKKMLIVACLMAVFATFDVVIVFVNNLKAFVYSRGTGVDPADVLKDTHNWLDIMGTVNFIAQTRLGEGMLIYRCWAVYGRSWLVIAIPTAIAIGNLACVALSLYYGIVLPSGSQFTNPYRAIVISTWVTTIALNLLTTSLIVHRIWRVCYSDAAQGPLPERKRLYDRIIKTIIESGLIYTLTACATAIAYISKSHAFAPLSSMASPQNSSLYSSFYSPSRALGRRLKSLLSSLRTRWKTKVHSGPNFPCPHPKSSDIFARAVGELLPNGTRYPSHRLKRLEKAYPVPNLLNAHFKATNFQKDSTYSYYAKIRFNVVGISNNRHTVMRGATAQSPFSTKPTEKDPYRYQVGFGNSFASEAMWLYRIRPSVAHQGFTKLPENPDLESNFFPLNPKVHPSPTQLAWYPFTIPEGSASVDFVDGLKTLAGNGDPTLREGLAIHVYLANTSMNNKAFCNNDGDFLILPQLGRLDIQTEFGRLMACPGELVVIQRGLKFRVSLPDGPSRGYIQEVFGSHYVLPDLGPLGANGLANPRDFEFPLPHFDIDQSSWNKKFITVGSISRDHIDPSIFCVLTAPSKAPNVPLADLLIFSPRWDVANGTFRPPYYHRNAATEFMGLLYGEYGGRSDSFQPGGASYETGFCPHGVAYDEFKAASEAELKPTRVHEGTIAFMFETSMMLTITDYAMCRSGKLHESGPADISSCHGVFGRSMRNLTGSMVLKDRTNNNLKSTTMFSGSYDSNVAILDVKPKAPMQSGTTTVRQKRMQRYSTAEDELLKQLNKCRSETSPADLQIRALKEVTSALSAHAQDARERVEKLRELMTDRDIEPETYESFKRERWMQEHRQSIVDAEFKAVQKQLSILGNDSYTANFPRNPVQLNDRDRRRQNLIKFLRISTNQPPVRIRKSTSVLVDRPQRRRTLDKVSALHLRTGSISSRVPIQPLRPMSLDGWTRSPRQTDLNAAHVLPDPLHIITGSIPEEIASPPTATASSFAPSIFTSKSCLSTPLSTATPLLPTSNTILSKSDPEDENGTATIYFDTRSASNHYIPQDVDAQLPDYALDLFSSFDNDVGTSLNFLSPSDPHRLRQSRPPTKPPPSAFLQVPSSSPSKRHERGEPRLKKSPSYRQLGALFSIPEAISSRIGVNTNDKRISREGVLSNAASKSSLISSGVSEEVKVDLTTKLKRRFSVLRLGRS
ncbi:hypothetical protein H0H93_009767 [Arthromyces matolae]|nr:hypothetical protein H0H93_009767 [Arthromyces matolae]